MSVKDKNIILAQKRIIEFYQMLAETGCIEFSDRAHDMLDELEEALEKAMKAKDDGNE